MAERVSFPKILNIIKQAIDIAKWPIIKQSSVELEIHWHLLTQCEIPSCLTSYCHQAIW